ncbi:MAG: hypothetical protein RR253_05785 [Oscillospiraceae bacterium]
MRYIIPHRFLCTLLLISHRSRLCYIISHRFLGTLLLISHRSRLCYIISPTDFSRSFAYQPPQ